MVKRGDFLNLVKNRKTTYEFSNKKVKDSDLKKILEAGRWAPSCGNLQPWHFIIIKNKKIIDKLIRELQHLHFPFISPNPSALIALILEKESVVSEEKCNGNIKSNFIDLHLCMGMAASHMTLEATNLGINSCLLTPKKKETRDILKLRSKDFPLLILGLGYEKKGAYKRKRERKKLKDIISYKR